MTTECFTSAVLALADFPEQSPPTKLPVANKLVGLLGGEPLLHPQFETFCQIMRRVIPQKKYRGLWTGLHWQRTNHQKIIADTFGYINNNRHLGVVRHSPILRAIIDEVPDPEKRQQLIEDCWLQQKWSGTITPKGLFFCEVAGAFDLLFSGPGGLPVEPGCWRRPLSDFQDQIDRWCGRCGIPLNLEGRLDRENLDDISPLNLRDLAFSPRIQAGAYILGQGYKSVDPQPWRYLK